MRSLLTNLGISTAALRLTLRSVRQIWSSFVALGSIATLNGVIGSLIYFSYLQKGRESGPDPNPESNRDTARSVAVATCWGGDHSSNSSSSYQKWKVPLSKRFSGHDGKSLGSIPLSFSANRARAATFVETPRTVGGMD